MINYWTWVNCKRENWRDLTEAVEQQKERLLKTLQVMFTTLTPAQHQRLISVMAELENQLTDPEDKRKSQTITKFLRSFKLNPEDSATHVLDRFRRELQGAIYKANSKGKTPEQLSAITRQELQKKLPQEPKEVIDHLLKQVQQGARIDDAVNKYLASKRAVGEDKVVARQGNLEMIEISTWRAEGEEQHLDKRKGMQPCHPLFKGTKWCVRFQDYFSQYASGGPLYLIRENGKPLILGHRESPWLDVNDEPPSKELMTRLSTFIMDTGIVGIAIRAVIYLPKPVETLEHYLRMGYYTKAARTFRDKLLGMNYLRLNGAVVEIKQYNGLAEALEGVKVGFDYYELEEKVTEVSEVSYHGSLSDLVYNLDSSTEDLVIDLLEKRYKDGDYGEIEDWDDLELEAALRYDRNLQGILSNANNDAIHEATMQHINRSLMEDLRTGDKNGFFVNTETWMLGISASDVDSWIKNAMPEDDDEDDDEWQIAHFMDFNIPAPDISLEFSDKMYNDNVRESLKGVS